MIGALGTLLFFAVTPVFANRSAGILGSTRANFWRLVVAAMFLGLWTYGFANGARAASLAWFVAGGVVGFGLGGLTMFHALPRLGSNLSNLIVQCGSAVAAATVEWVWLGTRLTAAQLAFAATTVLGIGLGLSPAAAATAGPARQAPRAVLAGVILAAISAGAQGVGAVISRKAFAMAALAHEPVDAGTAAFERVLGGLVVAALAVVVVIGRRESEKSDNGAAASAAGTPRTRLKPHPHQPTGIAVLWVLANALTGPVLGVTCFQWALRTTPAGIVQPIVAAAPLLTIPIAAYFENSRPRWIYYVGGCLAAAGVTGLALAR